MNMELIDCASHGSQPFGVVCGHLQSNGKKLGFHEQEAEEGRKPDAWCNECHERWQLMKQSEKEREQWEEVCNFNVVCGDCYEEIKEGNKTANTFDLEVLTIEKLLNQLSKQEYSVILAESFPSWLPEVYVQMMSNIATQVISIESKLLSMKDAIQVNLDRDKTDEWVFATSIAKDYWTFDIEQNIMYYEQIEEHFVPKKMNIHFNQWLQLCFLLQKLDRVQEKYLITIALQEALQESLYIINPSLVDHFKDII